MKSPLNMNSPLNRFMFKRFVLALSIALIISVCLPTLWMAIGRELYLEWKYGNDPEVYAAKKAQLLEDIEHKGFWGRIWWVVYPAAGIVLSAIFVMATSWAKVRKASVYITRIGQHSEIPVHQKDLQQFYPIAVNLSLAEIEASASTAHEKGYKVSRQMIEDTINYTRAIAGGRSLIHTGSGVNQGLSELHLHALPAGATPTLADLLRTGGIAPGSPLIMGYNQGEKHFGQPEHRDMKALKSVAIAGWQGSGKTLSTAYIIGSSVLAYGVEAFVVDPHKGHDEGLYRLIQPLEQAGLISVINPFDTPKLIDALNARLDRRLSGNESSKKGILLVIDELARLAKMDCFDVLITFLERCTEETRKANITFLGGSSKWTAKHFKGRADIRGCMNSALIHKTKPSQADLLLEDAREKKLVKHLKRPGDAILVTDFADTRLVQMPFCTRQDMETIAEMVGRNRPTVQIASQSDSQQGVSQQADSQRDTEEEKTNEMQTGTSLEPPEVKSELQERAKNLIEAKSISYGSIYKETGIGKSTAYNFVNGKGSLRDEQNTALEAYLERVEHELQRSGESPSERDERAFMNASERTVNV